MCDKSLFITQTFLKLHEKGLGFNGSITFISQRLSVCVCDAAWLSTELSGWESRGICRVWGSSFGLLARGRIHGSLHLFPPQVLDLQPSREMNWGHRGRHLFTEDVRNPPLKPWHSKEAQDWSLCWSPSTVFLPFLWVQRWTSHWKVSTATSISFLSRQEDDL